MIGLAFQIERDTTQRVAERTEKAAFRNIGHAAASIRKSAVASIRPAEGPSAPGTPPHTHTQSLTRKGRVKKGALPRSIVYAVDKQKQEAVIGPRFSVVDDAGAAHEHGGDYLGQDFPARPFMAPALEENIPRFVSSMAGSVGE